MLDLKWNLPAGGTVIPPALLAAGFSPLLAAIPFGDFPVFFFTSLGGALFDSFFVIMQRFNRPRVVKMAQREKRNRAK